MRDAVAVVEARMPRPTKHTEQVTFRIPREWLTEADALAIPLSRPGALFSRTDVFRMAIARGFEALRADLATPAKKPAKTK
jgi:hypothetical protein